MKKKKKERKKKKNKHFITFHGQSPILFNDDEA